MAVPAYADPANNQLGQVLKLPFLPQPDYWLRHQPYPTARNPSILGPDPMRLVDIRQHS